MVDIITIFCTGAQEEGRGDLVMRRLERGSGGLGALRDLGTGREGDWGDKRVEW